MKVGPALLVFLLLLIAACGGGPSLERVTAVIDTAGGEVELEVEIADTTAERRHGLKGRQSLPERAGMLFRYADDARGSFWMKDTLIPLSIAFLDAGGRLLVILDMEPCRADPCQVYDPGISYRTALEVNRGTFDRLGIAVGDVVRVEG